MTITVGSAATRNEKEVMTRYPVDEGLTGGTQKQTGRTMNLLPEGISYNGRLITSTVASKDKIGLG